jgi:hypothetical protein
MLASWPKSSPLDSLVVRQNDSGTMLHMPCLFYRTRTKKLLRLSVQGSRSSVLQLEATETDYVLMYLMIWAWRGVRSLPSFIVIFCLIGLIVLSSYLDYFHKWTFWSHHGFNPCLFALECNAVQLYFSLHAEYITIHNRKNSKESPGEQCTRSKYVR